MHRTVSVHFERTLGRLQSRLVFSTGEAMPPRPCELPLAGGDTLALSREQVEIQASGAPFHVSSKTGSAASGSRVAGDSWWIDLSRFPAVLAGPFAQRGVVGDIAVDQRLRIGARVVLGNGERHQRLVAAIAVELECVLGRRRREAPAVDQRLAAQMPVDEKARRADAVVRNDGDLAALRAKAGPLLDDLRQGLGRRLPNAPPARY